VINRDIHLQPGKKRILRNYAQTDKKIPVFVYTAVVMKGRISKGNCFPVDLCYSFSASQINNFVIEDLPLFFFVFIGDGSKFFPTQLYIH